MSTTLAQRLDQLARLEKMQIDHREEIGQAICDDYGGTRSVAYNKLVDVHSGVATARQVRDKLAKWMQDEHHDVEFPMNMFGKVLHLPGFQLSPLAFRSSMPLCDGMPTTSGHEDTRTFVSQAKCIYQPLGVVLIVAPWNYPWHLPTSGSWHYE